MVAAIDSAIDVIMHEVAELDRYKNQAYKERNLLVAALSKLLPAWRGKHDTTDPSWELFEPIGKCIEGVKPQQDLQLHTASGRVADGHHDGFAFRGTAAEVAADQSRYCRHANPSITTPQAISNAPITRSQRSPSPNK